MAWIDSRLDDAVNTFLKHSKGKKSAGQARRPGSQGGGQEAREEEAKRRRVSEGGGQRPEEARRRPGGGQEDARGKPGDQGEARKPWKPGRGPYQALEGVIRLLRDF